MQRLCLLLALTFSLCSAGTAAEVQALPLGEAHVELTAGSSTPLTLSGGSPALTRGEVKLTTETIPAGRYSISAGVRQEGDGLFLAAPRTMPPGEYTVRIGLSVDADEQYAASMGVFVEAPQPVPQTERPPVVLVNGFDVGAVTQGECVLAEDTTNTFGSLEEFLTMDGATVLFFDNCTLGTPAIEVLGAGLGDFIAMLEHPDGSPVAEVDIVAFSMGALIARAYLSGKQPGTGVFVPPADPKVRKLIMVAGEHFGAPLASLVNVGEQIPQLKPGSLFTWELNTWHQGRDDLRGVDALAIAGTGGTTAAPGDGVAPLAGASLFGPVFFSQEPERTRILPACHNQAAADIVFPFRLCNISDVIMRVDSEDHPTGRIIRSFLACSDEWREIGETPLDNGVLTANGTAYFALKDASDVFVSDITGVTATNGGQPVSLDKGPADIFLEPLLAGGTYSFEAQRPGGNQEFEGEVPAGGGSAIERKAGPRIDLIIPSAGVVDTLSVASDSLISLFGSELAPLEESAPPATFPLPTELADATVTANDEALGLLFAGPGQINAFLPAGFTGLLRIKVSNPQGEHTVRVLVADAVPTVFTSNASGQGPAAALHSLTSELITEDNPTSIGGFVSLFGTGLGALEEINGLLTAVIQPEVTVGGVPATVGFAGEAPGFVGLNQINIEISEGTPTGPAVPVLVKSGDVLSNEVTLAIE